MTTISCPGSESFGDELTAEAYGVFTSSTKEVARSRASAAIAHAFFLLDEETECEKGCHGPYWNIIEQEAYVYEVTRIWWTLGIMVHCKALGKYKVKVFCRAFSLADVLTLPGSEHINPEQPSP